MSKWITGEVLEKKIWTDSLFSLIIKAKIKPFIAGQYTKLALNINNERIQRAYSYVNAPNNNKLEFYLINVPNGKLSSNLAKLKPGNILQISEKSSGIFILKEIPKFKNLWMISTGTAIGPYLSILQDGSNLEKFTNIILIHAVRYKKDLTFLSLMKKLKNNFNGKLRTITIVSREKCTNSLYGRIPELIKNKELTKASLLQFSSKTCHVMLCGNPGMIKDTRELLENNYGMKKHIQNRPGNISNEQYW
ncbi:FAD-binding oxidoreductase [Candidatus Providencia siddallii]|uniref:Flavodoxin/ferredoxin--NADP reductase n=1 Tax=Candidatus Providencia siddallii TaxID=1715285 RepID=A0ABM9NPS8_9GAMM